VRVRLGFFEAESGMIDLQLLVANERGITSAMYRNLENKGNGGLGSIHSRELL